MGYSVRAISESEWNWAPQFSHFAGLAGEVRNISISFLDFARAKSMLQTGCPYKSQKFASRNPKSISNIKYLSNLFNIKVTVFNGNEYHFRLSTYSYPRLTPADAPLRWIAQEEGIDFLYWAKSSILALISARQWERYFGFEKTFVVYFTVPWNASVLPR